MDCNKCKLEMVNLFDKDVDQTTLAGMMEHIMQCPDCSNEYNKTLELLSMLKPKSLPTAPFLLKQNIINQLKMEEIEMKNETSKVIKLSSKVKKMISIAAILAIVMMIVPFFNKSDGFINSTAKAANSLIESSIKATELIKSMVIKLKVRTIANDNFDMVGTEYDMVDHTISKSFEKPEKWRVDKGERIVVFDGQNQYLWIPNAKYAIKAGKNAGFVEWFKILLDPETILKREQAGTRGKESKFTMEEMNGELRMSITSNALGNFINDYLKNKSIDGSDNRREYVFDSQTKLMKSLKIYILDGTKETLIVETEKIDYNTPIDESLFTINLPEGVEWKELTVDIKSETFSNITSKRAGELIINAMAKNEWNSIKDPFQQYNGVMMLMLKKSYGGLEVIKIGETFKSGLYRGEFVPCEVKLHDGTIQKFNLALRNDNKNKVWLVDGGL
jgi:outer membrane lipoprotein-sorting protein